MLTINSSTFMVSASEVTTLTVP